MTRAIFSVALLHHLQNGLTYSDMRATSKIPLTRAGLPQQRILKGVRVSRQFKDISSDNLPEIYQESPVGPTHQRIIKGIRVSRHFNDINAGPSVGKLPESSQEPAFGFPHHRLVNGIRISRPFNDVSTPLPSDRLTQTSHQPAAQLPEDRVVNGIRVSHQYKEIAADSLPEEYQQLTIGPANQRIINGIRVTRHFRDVAVDNLPDIFQEPSVGPSRQQRMLNGIRIMRRQLKGIGADSLPKAPHKPSLEISHQPVLNGIRIVRHFKDSAAGNLSLGIQGPAPGLLGKHIQNDLHHVNDITGETAIRPHITRPFPITRYPGGGKSTPVTMPTTRTKAKINPTKKHTHFIGLPLYHGPGLSEALDEFKRDPRIESLSLHPDHFRTLRCIHLTIGMLELPTPESIQKAVDLLDSIDLAQILLESTPAPETEQEQSEPNRIQRHSLLRGLTVEPAPPETGGLRVELRGVDTFNHERFSHLLFTNAIDPTNRLKTFGEKLRKIFVDAGLVQLSEKDSGLKLNATLINTVYMRKRMPGKPWKIDLNDLMALKLYENKLWATVDVNTVGLYQTGAKMAGGVKYAAGYTPELEKLILNDGERITVDEEDGVARLVKEDGIVRLVKEVGVDKVEPDGENQGEPGKVGIEDYPKPEEEGS